MSESEVFQRASFVTGLSDKFNKIVHQIAQLRTTTSQYVISNHTVQFQRMGTASTMHWLTSYDSISLGASDISNCTSSYVLTYRTIPLW